MVGTLFIAAALSGAAAFGWLTPQDRHVVKDRVSLVEINHLYDGNGRYCDTQIIWRDWNPEWSVYDIVDSRFVPKSRPSFLWPEWNSQRRAWVSRWTDSTWTDCDDESYEDVEREVYADQFRQTWTQHDPEITERLVLPPDWRRGLTNPPERPRAASSWLGR